MGAEPYCFCSPTITVLLLLLQGRIIDLLQLADRVDSLNPFSHGKCSRYIEKLSDALYSIPGHTQKWHHGRLGLDGVCIYLAVYEEEAMHSRSAFAMQCGSLPS